MVTITVRLSYYSDTDNSDNDALAELSIERAYMYLQYKTKQ